MDLDSRQKRMDLDLDSRQRGGFGFGFEVPGFAHHCLKHPRAQDAMCIQQTFDKVFLRVPPGKCLPSLHKACSPLHPNAIIRGE